MAAFVDDPCIEGECWDDISCEEDPALEAWEALKELQGEYPLVPPCQVAVVSFEGEDLPW